ncbi:hypothetical protein TPA0598_07_07460 [Streptomyces lydicamycinicus]|uniref:Uncharacterized protein n=1 Tax=Streptomyces lydicamycinicus TaxID=1546107 RepID=A0A0P4RD20_9ACTN|nr:hypothetical protein TPA0598_07_07460 [Streptomyces lydicamycinicus]
MAIVLVGVARGDLSNEEWARLGPHLPKTLDAAGVHTSTLPVPASGHRGNSVSAPSLPSIAPMKPSAVHAAG